MTYKQLTLYGLAILVFLNFACREIVAVAAVITTGSKYSAPTTLTPTTKKIDPDSTTIAKDKVSPLTQSMIPTTTSLFQNKKDWGDTETLVSDVDACCGMAVSDFKKVHIAYYDASSGGLIYLTNESGIWVSMVVDSTSYYSQVNTIVLAYKNGAAHILYVTEYDPDDERTNTTLKYATNQSGSWSHESIESGDHSGASNHTEFIDLGIVIDGSNHAHITYNDYYGSSSSNLYYAHNRSGSWNDTLISYNTSVYYGPSIALDSSGTPYIAYYDFDANSVKITHPSGRSSWQYETVTSITANSSNHFLTALTFDSRDKAHIVYEDGSGIYHAKGKSSSWESETVRSNPDDVYSLSAILTSKNQLQVTYCSSSYKMQYFYESPLGWNSTEIGSCYPSATDINKATLAIDNADHLYLVYQYSNDVKYKNTYSDTDGDGIENGNDSDDDGDGVTDSSDAFPEDATETIDTDGDGIGNNADTDDDGDTVLDADDAFPLDGTETLNTDDDEFGDNADTDDDGDGIDDSTDTDDDGDGTPDESDPDHPDYGYQDELPDTDNGP